MEYLTTKETAKKWGVNVSLVRRYCTQERIPGVIQRDGAWLIPEDAKRPMKIEPGLKEPVVLPALAQKLLRQKKKKSYHGLYGAQYAGISVSTGQLPGLRKRSLPGNYRLAVLSVLWIFYPQHRGCNSVPIQ